MKYFGIFLMVAGLVIAAGYGIFLLGKGFFLSKEIGIPIRVAVPVVVLGLILWAVAFIREKMREAAQKEPRVIMTREQEDFQERGTGR